MLARARRRPLNQPTGKSVSIPAPVGGWNARDALANMAPTEAVTLQNWFPYTTYCGLRYGYSVWSTGITGTVETVMAYVGGATNKLFGAAGTRIYDCSTAGAASASVTSLTNGRWQYINNRTAAGSYLQCVNGADKMRVFDGTNWHADGDGAPYDVTGVDTATCIGITLSHNRVWLTQSDTLKAWYLPTGAIGGAATAFDLSSFCVRGGYLMTIQTWTMDAGYGMDDMTVFITSKGEVLVYRGTDPSSSATWGLIGVYWIGAPIGRRCAVKYAGDLLLITRDGVTPMSAALQSSRLNQRIDLTDIIQQAVSTSISNYGSNYGWQMLPFPDENMLFLNVPLQEGQNQQQYVMNTITRRWCNFTGWNASCWELYNDRPYFGGAGVVCKAWDTLADNGATITGNALQAFNYFGSPGQNKMFTNMRPVFYTDGTPAVSTQMNIDFDLSDPTSAASFTPTGYGVWGTGLWGTATWGAGLGISQEWQGATGVGRCAAPHVLAVSQGFQLQWMSTDVIFKSGSLL